jgi:nitrogen fixation/metabolism regulation signal transduction histidine kinase
VVRKIADEHGAGIRIRNLHEGGRADGPVLGARVSISFSVLHPSAVPPAMPVPSAPSAA